jgi:ribonuclease HI
VFVCARVIAIMAALYFDGASRSNPGPSSYGFVILNTRCMPFAVLKEGSAYIGTATNNVAEYSGLVAGLEAAAAIGVKNLVVYGDSRLIINQLAGVFKCKQPHLQILLKRAKDVIYSGGMRIMCVWIPRAENEHADRLANKALDERPLD